MEMLILSLELDRESTFLETMLEEMISSDCMLASMSVLMLLALV